MRPLIALSLSVLLANGSSGHSFRLPPFPISVQSGGFENGRVFFIHAWDEDLMKQVEGEGASLARAMNRVVHEPMVQVDQWHLRCGSPNLFWGQRQVLFEVPLVHPDAQCLELVLTARNADGAVQMDVDANLHVVRAVLWPDILRGTADEGLGGSHDEER